MPRRPKVAGASRDAYGINLFGWTKRGKKSKKMIGKLYKDGRVGGYVSKSYGSLGTDKSWQITNMVISRRKR